MVERGASREGGPERGQMRRKLLAGLLAAAAVALGAVDAQATVKPNLGKFSGQSAGTVATNRIRLEVFSKGGVLKVRSLSFSDDCSPLFGGIPAPVGKVRKGRFHGSLDTVTNGGSYDTSLVGRFTGPNRGVVTADSTATAISGQTCTDTTTFAVKRNGSR
jgi:hypothetical protein